MLPSYNTPDLNLLDLNLSLAPPSPQLPQPDPAPPPRGAVPLPQPDPAPPPPRSAVQLPQPDPAPPPRRAGKLPQPDPAPPPPRRAVQLPQPDPAPPPPRSARQLPQPDPAPPPPPPPRRVGQRRRQRLQSDRNEKITPPFPWATEYKGKIHSMEYLLERGIRTITGQVTCKRCDRTKTLGYDLCKKFHEVAQYLVMNQSIMHERAPNEWVTPPLLACEECGHLDCCKPDIPDQFEAVNWLFLLLGQLVGSCPLNHLKLFCRVTGNHRTAAKNRLVYLSYVELCKQVDPRHFH